MAVITASARAWTAMRERPLAITKWSATELRAAISTTVTSWAFLAVRAAHTRSTRCRVSLDVVVPIPPRRHRTAGPGAASTDGAATPAVGDRACQILGPGVGPRAGVC